VQLESVREPIEALGGSLVGISVDSLEDSVALVQRLGLHFRLLSDANATIAAAYGAELVGMEMAVPAVVVVRRDRAVAWKRVGETLLDHVSPSEVLAQTRAAAQ